VLTICHPESERAKRAQATWLLASGQLRAIEAGTGFDTAKRSYNPSAIPPPAAQRLPWLSAANTRVASAPCNADASSRGIHRTCDRKKNRIFCA